MAAPATSTTSVTGGQRRRGPAPYRDWLRLDVSHCPPTPHQLLGIAPDETRPQVIEEAALNRAEQVRKYQLAYPQESTRLLNEIARAMTSLLEMAQAA